MPVLFSALQPEIPISIISEIIKSLEKYEEKLHNLFWLNSIC